MKYKVSVKDYEHLISESTWDEVIELTLHNRASKKIEEELWLMDFVCHSEDQIKEVEILEVY